MSSSSRSSYIDTLNDDVLSYIFAMNANMFLDKEALYITSATSIVCQRWRSLMLDSPSLWAKLIDIDCISYARHLEWRDELMKRSGTALLWIRLDWLRKIQPADPSKHILKFFYDVVHDNWHRIQKLVVIFRIGPTYHPTSWNTLCRSAPALETFDLTFERTLPAETPDTPISTLFSGCAPMLRKFILTGFTVDQRAPWLCHLHSMVLDGTYNVHLALGVLSSTHHLQRLMIGRLSSEQISTPFPIAHLPHLKYLEYVGAPQEGAILLDHVDIPLSCSLCIPHIYFNSIPNSATEEQCHFIVTTFSRYAQRYLRSRVPSVTSLNFHPT